MSILVSLSAFLAAVLTVAIAVERSLDRLDL